MRRRELGLPARMSRVAVVAPVARLRDALVVLADAGAVELVNPLGPPEGEAVEALRRLERVARADGRVQPRLAAETPDLAELERRGARDLLAGEVELERRAAAAVRRGSFAAFVGWAPAAAIGRLSERLARVGASVVELPRPTWAEPPTLLQPVRVARPFRPLVETYGTARYEDVDPTPFAAAAFVLMFGMMFGDVGHGLLLAALGLALGRARGRLAGFARLWPLPVAAGLSAALFGLLYGETFGPSRLLPTLWLEPLEEPLRLLAAAAGVGAVLLAMSYALGIVNRWREAGPAEALLAPSGIAGFAVFLGGGISLAGAYAAEAWVAAAGGAVAAAGVLLLGAGFLGQAGRGALAVAQATIEVVDAVVRVAANAISFTRLAAFGLMHAALSKVFFDAASALWGGAWGIAAAAAVLVVGNAIAFSLELLVAGVQALRLEYYELFSRIFVGEGHAFSPWSIPVEPKEAS